MGSRRVTGVSLAVIPARGGSKRVPRKNLRLISERPLIAWAIDAAIESGQFSDIVVTTDDLEIASVARSCGASVPFSRPMELADDFASTSSVVQHAVLEMQGRGYRGSLACCIYPASIFVTPQDYALSRSLLERSEQDFVSTVVRYSHPIQRALALGESGEIRFVDPLGAEQRPQDFAPRWHDAGQFYWGRVSAWLAGLPILENSIGYELPTSQVQDIDTEDDLLRAQRLHRELLAGSTDPQFGQP